MLTTYAACHSFALWQPCPLHPDPLRPVQVEFCIVFPLLTLDDLEAPHYVAKSFVVNCWPRFRPQDVLEIHLQPRHVTPPSKNVRSHADCGSICSGFGETHTLESHWHTDKCVWDTCLYIAHLGGQNSLDFGPIPQILCANEISSFKQSRLHIYAFNTGWAKLNLHFHVVTLRGPLCTLFIHTHVCGVGKRYVGYVGRFTQPPWCP